MNFMNGNEYIKFASDIIGLEDPTDRICIASLEQCIFIDELCTNNLTPNDYFDFLSGNIPLPHIEIEIASELPGYSQKIEVMVKKPTAVKFEGRGHEMAIGIARMKFLSKEVTGLVFKDENHGLALGVVNDALTNVEHSICGEIFAGFMTNFIGIQMCLLHPEYNEILKTYKTVPISENGHRLSKKAAKRQRVARYVKCHIIDDNKIRQAKQKKPFERKCKAWFVLGHWRQYKDGHRTFIQGYWKGPLREYKRNFDNVRIREVSKWN